MVNYYYIDNNNVQQGPFTVSQLDRMRDVITPSTPVWTETMPDWVAAGSVCELAFLFEQESRATPPPTRSFHNPDQKRYKPDSWLALSIVATILCCPHILGIPGIVFASRVDGLWSEGRYDEAEAAAKNARMWTIIAAVTSVVCWGIYLILIFVGVAKGLAGSF